MLKELLHKGKVSLLNSVSLAAFYLSGAAFRNQKLLKSLKGKFKGKRCFVVCNGPSLRPEDLTKIYEAGDYSIGMNLIGRIYKDTPWRATFLSAREAKNFPGPDNTKIPKETECEYILYRRIHYLRSFHTKGRPIYIRDNVSRDFLDHPVFGTDFLGTVPSIGTSTYLCLEFAVFLGFSEIYLIGCDMSYNVNLNRDGTISRNDAGKDYFFKTEAGDPVTTNQKPNATWEMEVAFNAAAKAAAENGYNIKNATRGGKLEFFPRVNFDDLF